MIITTSDWAEIREHADSLQVVQPGRHNRLLPKIYCSPQYRACLATAGGAAGQAQPAAAQDLM